MFTGLIQSVGTLEASEPKGDDQRLFINAGKLPMDDVKPGDSIAVNGVCLTVTDLESNGFWMDVSTESLAKTSLKNIKTGSPVNLEKALTLTTPLGGHLVSGHVDGLGKILGRENTGRSIRFRVQVPAELAKYIAKKGSVCVDGVSLTVNDVSGDEFDLTIIPHTLDETIINTYAAGTEVNIEVDLLARYLERLMLGEKAADRNAGISESFLREHGFIK